MLETFSHESDNSSPAPMRLETVYPLREKDPLLEIRKNDVETVLAFIDKNKISLIAHEARSGSTSVMNAVAAELPGKNFEARKKARCRRSR